MNTNNPKTCPGCYESRCDFVDALCVGCNDSTMLFAVKQRAINDLREFLRFDGPRAAAELLASGPDELFEEAI